MKFMLFVRREKCISSLILGNNQKGKIYLKTVVLEQFVNSGKKIDKKV